MREKGSLFRKYFSIYAATLFICVLMLGIALLYFASRYFRDINRTSLSTAAAKGIEATEINYLKNQSSFLTREDLSREYAIIHRTAEAMVFFCDVDGRIDICSEGGECQHTGKVIPQTVRESLLKEGEYFEAGYLDGFSEEGRYSYGRPVVIDDVIVGYLFASISLSELFDFLYQIILMFLFSSAAAFGLSFIIVYYATRILTSPLHEISAAAERFGAGDYSVRVEVPDDDEIGSLALVFNNMAASVAELETTRRNFVADVSHELRTPMTTISGYVDGILDGTIPRTEQMRGLQIASDEVKRLSRLTSSLLAIARMEAGVEAEIISYNAWDTVLNVMLNMELRISEKGIEIKEMDVSPKYVFCDPDMLHQIVHNILDNAVKFTPSGGTISVSLTARQEWTDIVIGNTGEGIKEERLDRIFERFYKSDKSRGLDSDSSGLGLYICKTLAVRMGGDISVNSIDGEYTEFTVKLRTAPARKQRDRIKIETAEETKDERVKKNTVRKLTKGFRKDEKR
ncbi:MAG: HAMP domain-containing histidine kinase [Oscillospiraceae bacterium]|nr:HAMP domain-containing histidine kinase [Oscillospiraceae bacterium]